MNEELVASIVDESRRVIAQGAGKVTVHDLIIVHLADELAKWKRAAYDLPSFVLSDDAKRALKGYPSAEGQH